MVINYLCVEMYHLCGYCA